MKEEAQMTSEGQHAGQQPAEATSGGPAELARGATAKAHPHDEPFGLDGFPPDTDGQGRAPAPPSAASYPVSYAPPPQSTPNGGSPFVVPTVFGQPSEAAPTRIPPLPGYGAPATPPSAGSARVPRPEDGNALPQRSSSLPQRGAASSFPPGDNSAPPSSAWAPPPASAGRPSAEDNPFARPAEPQHPYRDAAEPHPYRGAGDLDSAAPGDYAGFAPGSPNRVRASLDPADSPDPGALPDRPRSPFDNTGQAEHSGSALGRAGSVPDRPSFDQPSDRSGSAPELGSGAEPSGGERPPGVSAFGAQRVRVPGATLTGLPDAPPLPRAPLPESSGFPMRSAANGAESERQSPYGPPAPFDAADESSPALPGRPASPGQDGPPPFGRPAGSAGGSGFAQRVPGASFASGGAAPVAADVRGGSVPQPRDSAERSVPGEPGNEGGAPAERSGPAERPAPAERSAPAVGSARPVAASASVPVASRVAPPVDPGELPPSAPSSQPRVYGRAAPSQESDSRDAQPESQPRDPQFRDSQSRDSQAGDSRSREPQGRADQVRAEQVDARKPWEAPAQPPAGGARPWDGPGQPSAAQSGTAQPWDAQSGTAQPWDAQSGAAQPPAQPWDAQQAGAGRSASQQASSGQPVAQPWDAQSGAAQPAAQPWDAQPGAAQPAAQPWDAQPGAAQPAAQPWDAQQSGSGQAAAQPWGAKSGGAPSRDVQQWEPPSGAGPVPDTKPWETPSERPEDAASGSAGAPYPNRSSDDRRGAGGFGPEGQGSAPTPQSPSGRVSGRATASARVAPPPGNQPFVPGSPPPGNPPFSPGSPAPDAKAGPSFSEPTTDVAGRGRANVPAGPSGPGGRATPPESYSENTSDVSGRGVGPDGLYVPAPALPSMHARPPLEHGFPPPPGEVPDAGERGRPRLGGVFPGPASRATVTPPPDPDSTASWPGVEAGAAGVAGEPEQGRFDQFKPDAEADAAAAAKAAETPHVRMVPVLLSVIIGATLLVGLAVGIPWLISGGNDTSFSVNTGDCVKKAGAEAVKAGCGDPGSFEVVSIVTAKEQCADPGQPYVLNPASDGKTQVLCLKPRG
jgi:hypothetical protein